MAGRWDEQRRRYRAVLGGSVCVHPASVFDPASARIAADLGFEIGMLAGSVAATAVVGAPDNVTLTLTEFADLAHRICRAGPLPLMVDADHGYGNAMNAMRTVEELEHAGIAGMTIEDTSLPEGYGPAPQRLISREEAVDKLRACVAARRDPGLVIIGRTTALVAADMSEAKARIAAYAQTGVEAIFLVGVKTPDQVEELATTTNLPLILGNVPVSLMNLPHLSAHGVRICLQGHQPQQAAIEAVRATLSALRQGTKPDQLPGLASGKLMKAVIRADEQDALTRTYLGRKS
jgi:carboxyvinyl-carboxyphosphonate phosphorylmutase